MDREYIAEWFRFADMDLESAEYLQGKRPQPLEIICYHSQQAAEKYIKGYLISHGVLEPPKTHNLNLLMDMCLDYDKRFDEIEQACSTLTRYGVQPRYPRELGVTVNDTLKALEHARQVRDFGPLAAVRKEVKQD
jgi:HEPN domain-containing protein